LFHILEKQILETVSNHIQARYGVDVAVTLEQPKQASFGELAVPVAFQLAKQVKRAPKQIAAELAADLAGMPGVESLEVAGNGYLNIRLDRGVYGFAVLSGRDAV
jgi:arginyl-tRNA synthetase